MITSAVPALDIALFQPEIPENTAAMVRFAACVGARLHLIEPLGFALDTKKMRRIGMDYVDQATLVRHASFDKFRDSCADPLILASTKAAVPYWQHTWQPGHVLVMGQESLRRARLAP